MWNKSGGETVPAADARNFAKVRYTIRDGKVIYPAPCTLRAVGEIA
jgi:hypothetical protein